MVRFFLQPFLSLFFFPSRLLARQSQLTFFFYIYLPCLGSLDEDMVAMYLSDHRTRPLGTAQREEKDHGEIEILLESVQRQVEEIVNEVETTVVSLLHTFPFLSLFLRRAVRRRVSERRGREELKPFGSDFDGTRDRRMCNRLRRLWSLFWMRIGISCWGWICR